MIAVVSHSHPTEAGRCTGSREQPLTLGRILEHRISGQCRGCARWYPIEFEKARAPTPRPRF